MKKNSRKHKEKRKDRKNEVRKKLFIFSTISKGGFPDLYTVSFAPDDLAGKTNGEIVNLLDHLVWYISGSGGEDLNADDYFRIVMNYHTVVNVISGRLDKAEQVLSAECDTMISLHDDDCSMGLDMPDDVWPTPEEISRHIERLFDDLTDWENGYDHT